MRLNKIERDLKINDLKLSFSKFWTKVKIFVGGSFLVANIAACTPAVEDVNATSVAPTTTTESVVPSSSEEVASSEVTQSSEVQPTESTEVVEPTEEVNENTITADEAVAYVNQLMESHKGCIGYDNIPVAFLAINWDDMSEEDRNTFMETYGLEKSKLSDDLNTYTSNVGELVRYDMNKSGYGDTDQIMGNLDNTIKLEQLTMNEEYKSMAHEYDDAIEKMAYKADKTDLVVLYMNAENSTNSYEKSFASISYYMLKEQLSENIFDSIADINQL